MTCKLHEVTMDFTYMYCRIIVVLCNPVIHVHRVALGLAQLITCGRVSGTVEVSITVGVQGVFRPLPISQAQCVACDAAQLLLLRWGVSWAHAPQDRLSTLMLRNLNGEVVLVCSCIDPLNMAVLEFALRAGSQ